MTIWTVLPWAGYLVVLLVGVGQWGWWLAALTTAKLASFLAGLLLAYGLWVGWGSVVPSSAVISGAIALVVAFDIFPPFWPPDLQYKYWAYTVLALWAVGIVIVSLLAAVGQRLRRSPHRWWGRLSLLVGLLISLQTGATLYQAQWPGWLPWEHLSP
jgi:hypothetical protein